MKKTLVVYASRYGSSKEIAEAMGRILGPSAVIPASKFNETYRDFDNVVIGGGVYGEKIAPVLDDFVEYNKEWLQTKEVALFSVSMAKNDKYLASLKKMLGNCVVWYASFGGILDPEVLNEEDTKALKRFFTMLGRRLTPKDVRDMTEVSARTKELRRLFANIDDEKNMPEGDLTDAVEEFLKAHNTCALGTGSGENIRVTPLEYMYSSNALYILSEGGEKFANLMLNRKVSAAVFEPYTGFGKLASIQIAGNAELVPFDSNTYRRIVEMKNLDYDKLMAMPVRLTMIKINMKRCEFLYSEFEKQGYASKQILYI